MKRRIRKMMPGLLVGCLTVAGLFIAFMFRTEREDNQALGKIAHSYRWGKPSRISIDVGRDGTVDGRFELMNGAVDFSGPLATGEQSSYCDGFFDVLMYFDQDGVLERLGYDEDRDGSPEFLFFGDEASKALAEQGDPCRGFTMPEFTEK